MRIDVLNQHGLQLFDYFLNSSWILQDLVSQKDQGSACFNAALEAGEKLYPNTSNEGREGIRRELRSLRDSWEAFNDGLSDSQRQLDSSSMQWKSFDENFEQLAKWVTEVEGQMDSEPELKSSLQEKKALLGHYKVNFMLSRKFW